MKYFLNKFSGRVPRTSDRALPRGFAVTANSTRLLSNDLEAWNERLIVGGLAKQGPINTIYRLASRTGDRTAYWLHWSDSELAAGETNVDVALGPEPGDLDVATYFTGTTLGPQYTTKFLATDDASRLVGQAIGAYPYQSRDLGLNGPTSAPTITQTLPVLTENSVSYFESGAATSNWSIVRTGGGYANFFAITAPNPEAPTTGLTSPYYFLQWQNGGGALATWNEAYDLEVSNSISFSVNVDTAPDGVGPSSSEEGNGSIVLFSTDTGVGPRINLNFRSTGNAQYVDTAAGSAPITIPGVTLTGNTPVKVSVTGSKQAPVLGSPLVTWKLTIQVRDYATNTLLGQLVDVTATVAGNLIAFIGSNGSQSNATSLFFNDVSLTTVLAPSTEPVPVFTSYVYTTVNDLGWESKPSPPSSVVTVDNGITNNVTIPAQTEPNIVKVRLYRASVSTADAVYLLVAEILPPYPVVYADSIPSTDIGPDVLITTDFDPPPEELRGLVALPGGSLVGFFRNQLCFSEPNYPYAWPIPYRLTTDYNIVAIAVINSLVVVMTEAFVYLAAGNLPGDYAMEKLEYPQGCVSKRSVAYVSGYGVLFASPDGLYSITGSGAPRNTTETLFSRREWQLLKPETMIGIAHDDRYFGFYRLLDATKQGFILDFRQSGFGLIDIPDHATAVYGDPITDILYFVADDSYIEATPP